MAEIHIERKERAAWPWVLLGLLLLALLAWWLLSRNDGTDFATEQDTTAQYADTASGTSTGTGGATAGGAVGALVQWTRDNQARADADTTHEFTAEGLRRLAAAIETVAQRADTAGSVRAAADSIQMHAEALQRDWQSPNHANHVRLAFMQAATALERLREQRFPEAATTVAQVRSAAERVQGSQPLLEQRQSVQQFFDVASQTLQSMQTAAGATG